MNPLAMCFCSYERGKNYSLKPIFSHDKEGEGMLLYL